MKATVGTRYRPPEVLGRSPAPAKSTVVACLGESLTKGGRASYDWIVDLQSRPQNASVCFVKFAAGGDHAYNALRRLPQVIACRPDRVIVLIGIGDVVSTVSPAIQRFVAVWKRLPRKPSPGWYEAIIRRIVKGLKNETTARVALCSLPVLGEDPGSEANRRSREFSAIVKRIAREEHVAYVPFHERTYAEIAACPGRAHKGPIFLSLWRAAFNIFVLGKSQDEVGMRGGWRLHTDGIHLSSRGGKIMAELAQEFVAA